MSEFNRPRLVPMVFICAFIFGGLLAVVWMYAEVRRIKRAKIPKSEMVSTNVLITNSITTTNAR